jgi:hypothetical protein
MNGLSGYLGAKLLWDPKYDAEKAINDYLNGVYGAAAPHIRVPRRIARQGREGKHPRRHLGHARGAVPQRRTPRLRGHSASTPPNRPWRRRSGSCSACASRGSVDYVIIEHARHDADKIGEYDHQKLVIRPKKSNSPRASSASSGGQGRGHHRDARAGHDVGGLHRAAAELAEGRAAHAEAGAEPAGLWRGPRFRYYPGHHAASRAWARASPARMGYVQQVGWTASAIWIPKFGVVYRGLLRVKRAGIYSFHLQSNDGSAFYIDGESSSTTTATTAAHQVGQRRACVGLHPITVRYFQVGGEMGLDLQYQGPEITKQSIPADLLFYDPQGQLVADTEE